MLQEAWKRRGHRWTVSWLPSGGGSPAPPVLTMCLPLALPALKAAFNFSVLSLRYSYFQCHINDRRAGAICQVFRLARICRYSTYSYCEILAHSLTALYNALSGHSYAQQLSLLAPTHPAPPPPLLLLVTASLLSISVSAYSL